MKTKIIVPSLAVLTGLSIYCYEFFDTLIDSDKGPALFFVGGFLIMFFIGAMLDRKQSRNIRELQNISKQFDAYLELLKDDHRRTKNG